MVKSTNKITWNKYNDLLLKQWCIDKALLVNKIDDNGNLVQAPLIKTAQEIFNWVKK